MNQQKRKLITALSLCAAAFVIPNAVSAASISGQGNWETTLQGRDLDGNLFTVEAYYDADLHITWLADAGAGGFGTWSAVATWASYLNLGGWGWRLPTRAEMSHLYWTTLGNDAYTYAHTRDINTGPFQNLFASAYWSSEVVPYDPTQAYVFYFSDGSPDHWPLYYGFSGWAVHSGDIGVAISSAVPLPGGAWLLASGLLGLLGVPQRK